MAPLRVLSLFLLGVAGLVAASGPSAAQDKAKDAGKTYQVPFRLTDTGHLMVRLRINGKGPYNFIVDTGAPHVFVTIPVAKQIGLADAKGMAKAKRLDVEGGPRHEEFACLVDTPFQLEGMNALGMAGVEIHGVIGYTLLAHYKIEFDLGKDRLAWTRLDFAPPAPVSISGKGGNTPTGLDGIGKLMKFLAAMNGNKGVPAPALRGSFGVEIAEGQGGLTVAAVLALPVGKEAGLVKGDRLLKVAGQEVKTAADLQAALAAARPGREVSFVIERDGKRRDLSLTAREGF